MEKPADATMGDEAYIRDLAKKLHSLFVHREDCYAVQTLVEYIRVKSLFTVDLVADHIRGKVTVGVYQVMPVVNTVKWMAFDFDIGKHEEVTEDRLRDQERQALDSYAHASPKVKKASIVVFSGRRGYHFVTFFDPPAKAFRARELADGLASSAKVSPSEIFPKQMSVSEGGYGNLLKLPLGIHRKTGKRCLLIDPTSRREISLEESLSFLNAVVPMKLPELNFF